MPGIIGKKVGMTSYYDENGKNLSCTVIQAGPCVVTQVKTTEKDGYDSVQLGFDEKKEKNTPSPLAGHFKKANTTPKRRLKEFKDFNAELKEGDVVTLEDIFASGDFVDVTGTSKGKGFQGVVKRHNFAGVGQATHGQHNRQRHPGAIGACSYPARVFKGLKMAGRYGNDKVKIENLKVVKIYPDKNLLLVTGSVPGAKNSYVFIEK